MSDAGGLRSVSEVADLTGVTVRTLHYYEEIGLLMPAERTDSGYRLYRDDELLRLHEVLTWRDLGVPLDEIARVLDDPDHDPLETLVEQRRRLEGRVDELNSAIDLIDAAIKKRQEGTAMTNQELIEIFDGFDPSRYEPEATDRWGETDAYVESSRRAKTYGREEWEQIKSEGEEINNRFIDHLASGAPADSPEATTTAVAHRDHITRWFYEVSPEMHRSLAEMYLADPRFTATYENAAEGLARYIHDAIVASADQARRSGGPGGLALQPAVGGSSDEQDDGDHGQPEQSLEDRPQDGQDDPDDDQGEDDGSHAIQHGTFDRRLTTRVRRW